LLWGGLGEIGGAAGALGGEGDQHAVGVLVERMV